MTSLLIDVETASDVDIGKCGSFRYIEDDSFRLLLFGYSVDETPAVVVDCTAGEKIPQDIVDAIYDPKVLKIAHNAAFEREVFRKVFHRYTPPEQWLDTMHLSAHCGLPLSLAQVCEALGFPEDKAKMSVGKKLIREFCCPVKPTKKFNMATHIMPDMDPENWELFKQYCARDVDTELLVWQKLRRWTPDDTERKFWCLDQRINEKGIRADLTLAKNAMAFDARYKAELTDKAISITGLDNPSSVSQVKDWLMDQEGIEVPTLNKKAVADVVAQLQTDKAKEFMAIRNELSKTSTKKYDAFLRCACRDDHIKGCFQFFGGHTGRFCLTGDHEVLTPNGWVRLDEWKGGRIVVWNPTLNQYSFQESAAVSFDYEGEMVVIDSQRCQQVSTPEHKMLVTNMHGKWYESTAGDLYGKSFMLPITSQLIKKNPVYGSEAVRVLVMIQADGHYTRDGDLKLGFKKDRKIERCKRLLRSAGICFSESEQAGKTMITVRRSQQPIWVRMFREKVFDWWMLGENPDVIIDELENWDAYRCGPGSIQYTSTIEKNVDVIQAVCQLAGLSSTKITKHRSDDTPNWSDAHILNVWLNPGTTSRIEGSKQSKKSYSGFVYCATTTTGYFMVRRNGTVWITGNSGKLVQLQNLVQNHLDDLDDAREIVKDGDYDFFRFMYPGTSDALSQLIRTTLIPEDGHRFLVADFSAVEARVAAYLTGEQWRLDTFASGGDIYCASASQMFKVPVEKHGVNGHLRQKGKIAELALGYGGGVNALRAFGADKLGMTEEDMAETVDKWREASPHIVSAWKSIENAMIRCITRKQISKDQVCGINFKWSGDIVWMQLPSGRAMAYYQPRYEPSKRNNGRNAISYMGVQQQTRKWARIETFGGRLFENAVQAVARDLLRDAMMRMTAAGFDIRAHVHDECIVSEPLNGRTVEEMAELMGQTPDWAKGLPLRADGYACSSYRKD